MSDYPEHEKLKKISDKSQAIGEFLEWLAQEKGIELAEWGGSRGTALVPYLRSKESLLAEHFEIDRDRLEDEKAALLAEQRKLTSSRQSMDGKKRIEKVIDALGVLPPEADSLEDKATHLLSEHLNDRAPIGEEVYRPAARALIALVMAAKGASR